uniref:Uncharacterized protein n=1 Tax=Trichinella nativa TaxID=6335 RepID=A0A0V1KHE1_9BILA
MRPPTHLKNINPEFLLSKENAGTKNTKPRHHCRCQEELADKSLV